MRYLILAAAAAAIAATPMEHADAAKKIHRSHRAYEAHGEAHGVVPSEPNAFGNAAAGGNNANSMSGSNSAGENAIGRTNGGGGMR
jgi:hypothetical protein